MNLLFLLQLLACLLWVSLISVSGLILGRRAPLKLVLATGFIAVVIFEPLTNAVFGHAIGDADAAIGGGIFWTINFVIWMFALLVTYFFALPKPHKAVPTTKSF